MSEAIKKCINLTANPLVVSYLSLKAHGTRFGKDFSCRVFFFWFVFVCERGSWDSKKKNWLMIIDARCFTERAALDVCSAVSAVENVYKAIQLYQWSTFKLHVPFRRPTRTLFISISTLFHYFFSFSTHFSYRNFSLEEIFSVQRKKLLK